MTATKRENWSCCRIFTQFTPLAAGVLMFLLRDVSWPRDIIQLDSMVRHHVLITICYIYIYVLYSWIYIPHMFLDDIKYYYYIILYFWFHASRPFNIPWPISVWWYLVWKWRTPGPMMNHTSDATLQIWGIHHFQTQSHPSCSYQVGTPMRNPTTC